MRTDHLQNLIKYDRLTQTHSWHRHPLKHKSRNLRSWRILLELGLRLRRFKAVFEGVRKPSWEFYRQSECEHGTLAHTADGTNASSMRLDNRFRYGQAHTGALDPMPLILASVEFLEDLVDFLFFDSRPLVRNTETVEFVLFLCRDPDGLTWGGVELRVSDKVNQHPLRQRKVHGKS